MQAVTILLILEEEGLLGLSSGTGGLDENLHNHILHIYKRDMFKSRTDYEGKLLYIESW